MRRLRSRKPPSQTRFLGSALRAVGAALCLGAATELAAAASLATPPAAQWTTTQILLIAATSILVAAAAAGVIVRWRLAALRGQRQRLEAEVEERTRSLNEAYRVLEGRQKEISRQNAALEERRSRLEELVQERTAKMEDALELAENSERLKSSFLANVSHEIRTPMNAIVGFASLLEDPRIDDESRSDYVQLIRSNADVLLALIDEILEISRIEANEVSSHLQPFDLDLKFEELELLHKPGARAHVTLRFARDPAQPRSIIASDPLLLEQIMNSLLGNALKYTKTGSIDFGYTLDTGSIIIFVKDSGIGIPPEEHAKIFDPFFKCASKRTELHRGIGLGLSIAKSLVTLLGGDIWVDSELGKGSIFFVRLPRNTA